MSLYKWPIVFSLAPLSVGAPDIRLKHKEHGLTGTAVGK